MKSTEFDAMSSSEPTSHPERDSLGALATGQFTGQAAEALQQHLEQCPTCAKTFDELSIAQDSLVARLKQLPPAKSGDPALMDTLSLPAAGNDAGNPPGAKSSFDTMSFDSTAAVKPAVGVKVRYFGESHQSFAHQHKLAFPLISDTDGSLRKLFGVTKTLGLFPGRVTYVLDKEGIVRLIYSAQLAGDDHVRQALRAVGVG